MSKLKDLIEIFKVKHETIRSKGVKLQIVENSKVKMFKLDDATHSIINKRSLYTGGYWDYLLPIFCIWKDPKILMIGVGMGTTIYQVRSVFGKKVNLDAVESDLSVIELARKHTKHLKSEKIIIADGANYVARSKKKYDLIILDAYEKAARIPAQFLTEKFVKNVYKSLEPKGILAINYAMNPHGVIKFAAFLKLLEKRFLVYSVVTDSYGGTQLILCSKNLGKEEMLNKIKSGMKTNMIKRILLEKYEHMREL